MKRVKLSREEQHVEDALIKGEYKNVSQREFESVAQAIAQRRKDAVLNIRMNSQDLKQLKQKARKLGVRYQTFVAEVLHRIAHS